MGGRCHTRYTVSVQNVSGWCGIADATPESSHSVNGPTKNTGLMN